MQWVESGRMAQQTAADTRQCPAECSIQKQVEGAVWSPLMEEHQSTGEAATQGKLALDQEEGWASAIGILSKDKHRSMDENGSVEC